MLLPLFAFLPAVFLGAEDDNLESLDDRDDLVRPDKDVLDLLPFERELEDAMVDRLFDTDVILDETLRL